MVGIIIKVVIGLALFAGSLVGGLAATGRLNHEGTANIPVLSSLFPEPEKKEGEEGEEGADGAHGAAADGHAAPAGEGAPVDGSHSTDSHSGAEDAAHDAQGHGEQGPGKTKSRSITGPSIENPEVPKADAHGGGHGADPHAADAHGDDPHADAGAHGADPHAADGHEKESPKPKNDKHGSAADRDFDNVRRALRSQGKVNYEPGAFFSFDGMPAGLTPQQLNDAWQRVQGLVQSIDQRKTAQDVRDKELQELADDISRRWKELGEERQQIEQMELRLDAKIAKFEQTVRLVRNDEKPKLKRTAETLAAFEASKAAELVQQQWATEMGQDEVLRVLEFMNKDSVNEILAELPNAMIQDVLQKRMQISREAEPTGR